MTLSVWAIDPSGTSRGLLSPIDVEAVLRRNGLATWRVEADISDPVAQKISAGWSLVIDDGVVRVSGRVTSFFTEVGAVSSTVEFSGLGELHRLRDRIVLPDPASDVSFQKISHFKATGPAEDVIKTLVNLNAGPGALPVRQSPGLRVAPSASTGRHVKVAERFSNLLEACQSIASVGGLVFDAIRQETGEVLFETHVPRDLSRQCRFSATGTVKVSAASATSVVIAGQGEGAARTLLESNQIDGWGHRVEIFKDRRDTNDTEELQQTAQEVLEEASATASATFSIQEEPGRIFGKDFMLGDRISFSLNGTVIAEPVVSAKITWDKWGRKVTISLGDTEESTDPAVNRQLRALDSRLRGIETRH